VACTDNFFSAFVYGLPASGHSAAEGHLNGSAVQNFLDIEGHLMGSAVQNFLDIVGIYM